MADVMNLPGYLETTPRVDRFNVTFRAGDEAGNRWLPQADDASNTGAVITKGSIYPTRRLEV